jgi:hypothetical protein
VAFNIPDIPPDKLKKYERNTSNDGTRRERDDTGSVRSQPVLFCHAIFALIPKVDSTKFRWIGLLEVISKMIGVIINNRLVKNIELHEGLHGFRPKRRTGTCILETKLLMQLAQRSHALSTKFFWT